MPIHPMRCSSSAPPTPTASLPSPVTPTCSHRWRCSPTSSTAPNVRPSSRTHRSAPSGWRSAGRSPTTCPCAVSICLRARCWPNVRRCPNPMRRCTRPRRGHATPSRPSPRQPVTTMQNAGGKTSWNTASTAPTPAMHRSWRSVRQWPSCARCASRWASPTRCSSGGVKPTCARPSVVRWPTASATSPSSAGHGTCRRSARPPPRRRHAATPQRCAACPRQRLPSPGCRGHIAASPAASGTAPGSLRPVGTTTCTRMPAPTSWPAGSARLRMCCAVPTMRCRPPTWSRPRGWPRPWRRCAAGRWQV